MPNLSNEELKKIYAKLGNVWGLFLNIELAMRLAIDKKMGGKSVAGPFNDQTGAFSLRFFSNVLKTYNSIFSDKISEDLIRERNRWAHGSAMFRETDNTLVRFSLEKTFLSFAQKDKKDKEYWALRNHGRNVKRRKKTSVNIDEFPISTLEKQEQELIEIIKKVEKNSGGLQ